MRASDTIVSPNSFTQKITTTVNYYVSPTGNDTTGIGTTGNPYLTITKVLNILSDKVISQTGFVNIILMDGTHSYSSAITINHPNGDRIAIIGQNYVNVVFTAFVSYSGSSGNYSVTATASSVTGISIGDYLVIPQNNCSTTVDGNSMCGCWQITGISGNNITFNILGYGCPTSSCLSSVGNNIYAVKSKIYISSTSVNGIIVQSMLGNSTVAGLQYLAIISVSSNTYNGLYVTNGGYVYVYCIGISSFSGGIRVENMSYLSGSYCGIFSTAICLVASTQSYISLPYSGFVAYKLNTNSTVIYVVHSSTVIINYCRLTANYNQAQSQIIWIAYTSYVYAGNSLGVYSYNGLMAERSSHISCDSFYINLISNVAFYSANGSFIYAGGYTTGGTLGTASSPAQNTIGNNNSYINY